MAESFSIPYIVIRRCYALLLGVGAFPFVCWFPIRARVYSFLYRLWIKTSDEPVWLTRMRQDGDGHL